MRISIAFLVLPLLAACHDTDRSGASLLAIVGAACSSTDDCAPSNGACVGGVCKGGDGDPCAQVAQPFDVGPCLAGFACAPCDVATFGAWECACADPWATPPTGCAPSVCLPMVDACHTAGWTWDPAAQSCGAP